MKLLAIMQPTYLPWIGYFDLINRVNDFVFLDVVQLAKRSWQVRNRIKTKDGDIFLSVPIQKTKSRNDVIISESLINDNISWRSKHLKSIKYNYERANYFNEMYGFLELFFNQNINNLCAFNINFIKSVANKMNISTNFILASELNNLKGTKDDLLVSICKELSCNKYLSPLGSKEYIDRNNPDGSFSRNDIELLYHNYNHPTYSQLHGDFIPYMSIIDLLFNHGFKGAKKLISAGG